MSKCSTRQGKRLGFGRLGESPDHESRERSVLLVAIAYTTGYIIYYLSNTLFLVASLPFLILLAPFSKLKRKLFLQMGHLYTRALTRVIAPQLGVWDIVEVSGMDRLKGKGPFIFVSNHRGRLDALLVVGLIKKTSVVIKAKHARFPLLAFLVRHAGFVSVDQRSPESIASALQKCGELLSGGTNLLVFPEGSRSTGSRLHRFGNLAFRVAVDHGITVVPLVVHSRTPFMCKRLNTFYPRKPVHYRIRLLEPLHPSEQETTAGLSDKVYRAMASELKTLECEAPQGDD